MTEHELSRLVEAFERDHKHYQGWTFSYEYPGYFAYLRDDGRVYFTPDWGSPGHIAIQVEDDEGDVLDGDETPYSMPLDAAQLFRIVQPYLTGGSLGEGGLRRAREKLDAAFGPHMGLNADWNGRAWYVAGEGEENRNPDRPDVPAALYTHHGIWIIETEDDQYCVLERTHVDDDDDTDNIEEEFCAPPEGIEAVIAQARFTAMRQIPGYQMPSNKPPRDENPRARWRP